MKAIGPLLLGLAAVLAPAALRAQGIPLGPEFQANAYTTGREGHPDVASAGDGSFVVVWARGGAAGTGIFARRYDAQGLPVATGFQVNSGTAVPGQYPKVAADASGGFVVVWGDADGYNSHGRRFDSSGAPVGSELSLARVRPVVASDAAGNFIVVSTQVVTVYVNFPVPWPGNLFGRRFDSSGVPTAPEFLLNDDFKVYYPDPYINIDHSEGRAIASSPGGDFVVAWTVIEDSFYPLGGRPADRSSLGLFGQRFSKTGAKVGPKFPITTAQTTAPSEPPIGLDATGNFIVVWSSVSQDGDGSGIRGQRYDSSGAKLGAEFPVNTYTTGDQTSPSVAVDGAGNFVVVWTSANQDGSSTGVFGARFDRHGNRVGSEFPVNVYTSGAQQAPRVAPDGRGFVAVWESADQDGDDFGVFGRRQNLRAEALTVDASSAPGTSSDTNGVLEPGETVRVVPRWTNATAAPIDLTATASLPSCPVGSACVAAADASAAYGVIAAGASADCSDGSADACYQVSATGPRPATHWDGDFTEGLSVGGGEAWALHVGDSFSDVPRSQTFYKKIETLLHNGITSGCTASTYCPDLPVSRGQMAIFVAKGIAGSGEYVPTTGILNGQPYNCSTGGVSRFSDVTPTDSFCSHVHYIGAQNVTLGCSATQYCPGDAITRDAMASFIAKAVVAPGGGNAVPVTYGPDPVTGLSYSCAAGSPNLHFTDVPVSNAFCRHIHYLWAKGIVSGCSATQYCPSAPVARDAMAKFIGNGFGLELYVP
jgi:hypothetical protein